MTKTYRLALLLTATAGLLVGCSASQEDVNTSLSKDTKEESFSDMEIRNPNDFILGDKSTDGRCDESVIGIDHEQPTADITYRGQPGDKIKAEIRYKDKSKEPTIQSFEMGSTQTEMQLPTNIRNSSISDIKVTAEGRVGVPGECTIEVE